MKFTKSQKSQAEQIELLKQAGWKEDQSRDSRRNGLTNLYLWRWRQPGTGALFTLHGAFSFLESLHVTPIGQNKKKQLQTENSSRTIRHK